MAGHTKMALYKSSKAECTKLKTNTLIFNTIISIYMKLINMLNFFCSGYIFCTGLF